ncbi:gamma-glutamylcyclotransferase [Salinibacillus xinjiangensis]|nr:gamma-glutamylcyclotransferase [Salinibacillus xinjiangensis]
MEKSVYVFVYGTLLNNERNHQLLHNARCIALQSWTYGELYDTGYGYPALVVNGDDRVYGEIYEVNGVVLKQLDQLEGYTGKAESNHYDRITQTIYTDFGTYDAYIYIYTPSQITNQYRLPFGDWRCHQYLEQSPQLYFAYGSCMDEERFQIAGVDHLFKNVKGCGIARNFVLTYSLPRDDGGRANMVELEDWVEGIVYEVNEEAVEYLFKREGVHSGTYRPAFIDVEINGQVHRNVMTFLVIDKQDEVAPPEHYAREILRGAKGRVSDAYFKKLEDKITNKFNMNVSW